jgi:hypothetical protein
MINALFVLLIIGVIGSGIATIYRVWNGDWD